MAGGPFTPSSIYPVGAPRVFANVHVGAGSTAKYEYGLGVLNSISADSIWGLRWLMPPGLPTGTCKLRLLALANATTGDAKVNPKWASVAVGEDPASITLQAEGTSTLSWAAGDNDKYKELKIALDADLVVASEVIAMNLTFETASWTLAVISTWIPSIIWE